MSDNLRSVIKTALYSANQEMLRAHIDHGNPLLNNKQIPEVERTLKFRYEQIVDTVINAIEESGYTKPPAGDLRAQLLQLGRTLKGEQWGEDYSADHDDPEYQARRAAADLKSEIGSAILYALESE